MKRPLLITQITQEISAHLASVMAPESSELLDASDIIYTLKGQWQAAHSGINTADTIPDMLLALGRKECIAKETLRLAKHIGIKSPSLFWQECQTALGAYIDARLQSNHLKRHTALQQQYYLRLDQLLQRYQLQHHAKPLPHLAFYGQSEPGAIATVLREGILEAIHHQIALTWCLEHHIDTVTTQGNETFFRGISGKYIDYDSVESVPWHEIHMLISKEEKQWFRFRIPSSWTSSVRSNVDRTRTTQGSNTLAVCTSIDVLTALEYATEKRSKSINTGWVYVIKPPKAIQVVAAGQYKGRGSVYYQIDFPSVDPDWIHSIVKVEREKRGSYKVLKVFKNPHFSSVDRQQPSVETPEETHLQEGGTIHMALGTQCKRLWYGKIRNNAFIQPGGLPPTDYHYIPPGLSHLPKEVGKSSQLEMYKQHYQKNGSASKPKPLFTSRNQQREMARHSREVIVTDNVGYSFQLKKAASHFVLAKHDSAIGRLGQLLEEANHVLGNEKTGLPHHVVPIATWQYVREVLIHRKPLEVPAKALVECVKAHLPNDAASGVSALMQQSVGEFHAYIQQCNKSGDSPKRYGGIGTKVHYEPGVGVVIDNVFPGTPAARAGLKPGQVITSVTDRQGTHSFLTHDAVNKTHYMQWIRGEVGTEVTLTLSSSLLPVTICRDEINAMAETTQYNVEQSLFASLIKTPNAPIAPSFTREPALFSSSLYEPQQGNSRNSQLELMSF